MSNCHRREPLQEYMTGEPSWTECATQVMEGKEQVWFTVQAIVTEIREGNRKPSMHRVPPNEACRSLRSCLRHHAKKDNGKFVRKQSGTLIQYALRKEVRSRRPQGRPTPPGPTGVSRLKASRANGSVYGPVPIPPTSPTPPSETVVVEVDNPNIPKPHRPRQPRDSAQPGFLLPSPSLSLLGARRTLSVLCAGEAGRPVRRTRGRGEGERARDRVHSHRPAEAPSAEDLSYTRPAVLSPEELFSVSTQTCHVAFLKSTYEGSPVDVQGDRVRHVLCEVDPNISVTSASSCSSSDESETELSSDEAHLNTRHMTNISTTCHKMNKASLPPHKPTPNVAMATSRRSELARQISHLLSSSSPLVGENLKVLLGGSAFEGLSLAQRQQLSSLLPLVDKDPSGRVQPVALSNSFFGSACREWQDHLSLGLHVTSGGRRTDKKTRNNDSGRWKDTFFETSWGERLAETEMEREGGSDAQIFFPHEPTQPLSQCLTSILAGYHPAPPPPLTTLPSLPLTTSPPPPTDKPSPPERTARAAPRPSGSRRSVKTRPDRSVGLRSAAHRVGGRKRGETHQPLHIPHGRNHSTAPPAPTPRPHLNHSIPSHKARAEDCMYLSPLPHKMSYAALIEALHKASRSHKPPAPPPSTCDPTPSLPTLHSHPVYLDHFSTLHPHSVPLSFFPAPPPTPPSFLVSLPRSLYTSAVSQRAAFSDHNYTPMNPDPPPTLPLSLPRALLSSSSSLCVCSSQKLMFCSSCNSLYHLNCSHGNLCSSCTGRPSLN